MEKSIRKSYELLATNVLRGFDDEWVSAILSNASESEFDRLRLFFKSDNYQIFCGLCNINAEDWQKFLEALKTRASTNKKIYAELKQQWLKRQHLLMEEELI